LNVAVETEEHRAHRITEPAVGDVHVDNRLRLASNPVPDPDGLEQPACRRHDRRGTRIIGGLPERRVRHRHPIGRTERLLERDRERQARKAPATDQHVAPICALGHSPLNRIWIDRPYSYCQLPPKQGIQTAMSAKRGRTTWPPRSKTCSPFSTSSNS